jgi:hypothetical protein
MLMLFTFIIFATFIVVVASVGIGFYGLSQDIVVVNFVDIYLLLLLQLLASVFTVYLWMFLLS